MGLGVSSKLLGFYLGGIGKRSEGSPETIDRLDVPR